MSTLTKFLDKKITLNPLDILLDADALIALSKTDDTNHQKAVQISNFLQDQGAIFYVSPFTISEAATVLSYKVSHAASKKFLKEVRELAIPLLELPEKSNYLADIWFLKQTSKKGVSYPDCYNMALLERYHNQLQAIFSFDQIYRKNGFAMTQAGLDKN